MELEEIVERMHSKKLYYSSDESLVNEQAKFLEKLYDFNHTRPAQQEERAQLLTEMFAEMGENCYIEPPLRANWGGKYVHLGKNVYANFNLMLVDDTDIYIGDNVMIGPNVVISAGTHPIHPVLRSKQAQYNASITIGKNVWIGAGAIILPGVQIGEHSVIGAGSVVCKDIPANVIAVGNPCKVLRTISEHDRKYYYKDREIDIE